MSGLISALFSFEPLGDLLCCHRDGFTLPLLDLNICHCRPTVRAFRGSRQGVWFFTCTQNFFLSLIMGNHPELVFYVYIYYTYIIEIGDKAI